MRLDLYVTLKTVTARLSPHSKRPLVALEYTAVGQPLVGPLFDWYAVNHEVAFLALAKTARALGVELEPGLFEDHEACAVALQEAVGHEVVVTVVSREVAGRSGWELRHVRAPEAA